MRQDFVENLINAVRRVTTPDPVLLKEILILGGMPENTENLRYLGFNRHVHARGDQLLEFSAVAVLNNRRVSQWRLTGRRRQISRIVFDRRWTRNPLDMFLNNIRCHDAVMDDIGAATEHYSLIGLLYMDDRQSRTERRLRPVLAVPGLNRKQTAVVETFERANEMVVSHFIKFPVYRRSRSRRILPGPAPDLNHSA